MPGIGEIPGIGGVGFVVVVKESQFREREFESQVVKAGPLREARPFFANRVPASLTRYSRYVNEIFNSGRMLCEVRIRDVTDGTSNTLMVTERVWDGGDSETRRGAIWAGKCPGSNVPLNAGNKYSAFVRAQNHPDWLIKGLNNNSAMSRHHDGVFFVLSDGSVRFLSKHTDGATYQRLGQMADGEVISEF